MDVQLTDVKQVSFSLDGSKLMVVSSQSDPKKPQIQVIDPLMMKQVAIKGIVNDDSKYVEAVFSPNGQMVLTGGSDGDLRAFDADTGMTSGVVNSTLRICIDCVWVISIV